LIVQIGWAHKNPRVKPILYGQEEGRRFSPDLDHPVGQFWSTTSIEPAATEVVERLENHALPWLWEYATETSLAGYLRDCKAGIPLVNLCARARIVARTGMHDEVADVMARAQAELDRLKAESRRDQWELCHSLVLATEEWIKMEDQASQR
jgi:hypothetical protein